MAAIERLVFFGTPSFAVPTLDALEAAGRAPSLVVTQPTRAVGRGRHPQPPPVARWAEARGIEPLQPRRIRDPEFVDRLLRLRPDVAVVVAFGQIFPQALLDVPRLGCVNLHSSLLPRHRGAAPVVAAIAAGDPVTGVSTMLMEAGLDTGPILLQRQVEIRPRETAGELEARLAPIGGELMVETLVALERGDLVPIPQPEEGATYAPRLRKEDGVVDWRQPAEEIDRRLRAFTPWPGLVGELRAEPLKLVAGQPLPGGDGEPGEIARIGAEGIDVVCGEGIFRLEQVQRPGRRALDGRSFANGERLQAGERFAATAPPAEGR